MTKPSSPPRPSKLSLLGVTLAIALLPLPASASAWTREAAPVLDPITIQPESSMTVLPDGSSRYLILGSAGGGERTNQVVERPSAGPATALSPFPALFGEYSSFDFLALSPADAAGNQLAYRSPGPFGAAFLAPGADPAAAMIEPTEQITQIDLAPSGEAVAIVSEGSTAAVSFREAGPGGSFDALRPLDRGTNWFSYGIGITLDPDGGVFVLYRTGQEVSLLQAYAPPGEDFGEAQLVDVPAHSITQGYLRYGQSTNGHAILAWSEDSVGNTNTDEVWAMTRQPGGLLGGKSLVAEATPGRLVNAGIAAVTDDGTQYVSYLDANPVSGCPNNNDGDGGSVLARRGSGPWEALNTPTAWPQRSTIEAISTSGNAVGVMTMAHTDGGERCDDDDPVSRIEVQLGQGGSLGGPTVVTSENITDSVNGTYTRARGFAVNAAGTAVLLASEPTSTTTTAPFLYYQEGSSAGGGGSQGAGDSHGGAAPISGLAKPLPAPGKILLSGRKLVAKGRDVPFEAGCTRLPGQGSKLFCSISAILREEERRKGKAKSSAAKGKGAKPKVLGKAKAVKVAVGKTGTVTLKLNGAGKQALAASKGGLPVVLEVTINRDGYAPNTITRKLSLVAGKAKAKKAGGGKDK